MEFPEWAPSSLVESANKIENFLNNPEYATHFERPIAQKELDGLARLGSRHQMEEVWRSIFSRPDFSIFAAPDMLTRNGGILTIINRKMRSFDLAPKLTDKQYDEELQEIEKMSKALALKLNKFCDGDWLQNPFRAGALFSKNELSTAEKIIDRKFLKQRKKYRHTSNLYLVVSLLEHHLPPINTYLSSLATAANNERVDKRSRLSKAPRKINDKNARRTYFIGIVKDYFVSWFVDDSPTRIATYCSVALDDAEITPDLVRKLFPTDEETKTFLKQVAGYVEPEDLP